MKETLQEQLDAVLDVGFAERHETSGFKSVKHDDFLSSLQKWLHSYGANWFERPQITITQGLADHGVDVIATFPNADLRMGFQVWSWGDINRKNLMQDVWRQIGEAGSLGLDTLYLILCADMTDRSQYQKIRLFVNQVEQGEYRKRIEVIPPEKAWKLYKSFTNPIDAEEIRNRVTTFARFMRIIGRGQELQLPDSIYAHFDTLYVPPANFTEIQEKLDTNDIVVIVGTPHTGKTITAVKVLYDYFCQGYHPFWVFNRPSDSKLFQSLPDVYHRQNVHDSFSLETMIKPGCILYLEDPYGSTTQEEIDFVNSERKFNIDELVYLARSRSRNVQNHPKIIITSREGIYYRAIEQQPELAKYAVKFTVGDDSEDSLVSYNFLIRAEIVERYVKFYEPRWCSVLKEDPKERLDSVEEILSWAASFLWTPHSLQRFFFMSRDTDLNDQDELKHLVRESVDIARSFEDEMELFTELEQLVGIVIFLENHPENPKKHRIKARLSEKYKAIALALGYKDYEIDSTWNDVTARFSSLLEHIENQHFSPGSTYSLRFIHPAYLEAVVLFLVDNPRILDSLFSSVRLLLQTEAGSGVAEDLTNLLHYWYKSRPNQEAQILEGYLTSKSVGLLSELVHEYAYLYPFVEDSSLKIAIESLAKHPGYDHEEGRRAFIQTAHDARHFTIDQRCQILSVALDIEPENLVNKGRSRPYDLVCQNYGKVTEELRNQMEEYITANPNCWLVVGRSFGEYYDLLPQHLRHMTEQWIEANTTISFFAKREVITGLVLGFSQTNNGAHHLLKKLLESSDRFTRAYAVRTLVPIFHKLSDELRLLWNRAVDNDPELCATSAANHILRLFFQDTLREQLEQYHLVDFALGLVSSELPLVRAEMLGVLLTAPNQLSDQTDQLVKDLLFDDLPVVRAATLYAMLKDVKLQERFPERFQMVSQDITDYSNISRLLYSLNQGGLEPIVLTDEIELLKDSRSPFMRNALLFHMGAQVELLPATWQTWLRGEAENDLAKNIFRVIRWKSTSEVKRIFEPHWYIDYEDTIQLYYYEPELAKVNIMSGVTATIKMLDEIESITVMNRMMSKLKSALN